MAADIAHELGVARVPGNLVGSRRCSAAYIAARQRHQFEMMLVEQVAQSLRARTVILHGVETQLNAAIADFRDVLDRLRVVALPGDRCISEVDACCRGSFVKRGTRRQIKRRRGKRQRIRRYKRSRRQRADAMQKIASRNSLVHIKPDCEGAEILTRLPKPHQRNVACCKSLTAAAGFDVQSALKKWLCRTLKRSP